MVNRRGEDFMEVKEMKWKIEEGKSKFKLKKMLKGEKIMGEIVKRFIKEN